jgi:S1-C subfamily serine protease
MRRTAAIALMLFVATSGSGAAAQQDITLLRAPARFDAGLVLRDRAAARGGQAAVVVTAVEDGSPADLAGIRARDVIETIDETSMTTAKDVLTVLRNTPAGKSVMLTIRRGRARLQLTVVP